MPVLGDRKREAGVRSLQRQNYDTGDHIYTPGDHLCWFPHNRKMKFLHFMVRDTLWPSALSLWLQYRSVHDDLPSGWPRDWLEPPITVLINVRTAFHVSASSIHLVIGQSVHVWWRTHIKRQGCSSRLGSGPGKYQVDALKEALEMSWTLHPSQCHLLFVFAQSSTPTEIGIRLVPTGSEDRLLLA